MLKRLALLGAFALVFAVPAAAQYYPPAGQVIYYQPSHATHYRHHFHDGRRTHYGHRVRHDYRRAYRAALAPRFRHHAGHSYRVAPPVYSRSITINYTQPIYVYRQAPAHGYHAPQPSYGYVPQPAYQPRQSHQAAVCARARNPASRQACQCAVAYGGTAHITNHGRLAWEDPRGGGGILALQRCKLAGNAIGDGD